MNHKNFRELSGTYYVFHDGRQCGGFTSPRLARKVAERVFASDESSTVQVILDEEGPNGLMTSYLIEEFSN